MRYSFALTCAVFALFLTPAMAEDRPTVNSESVKAVDNHPVSKKGAGAELLVFGISKQFLTEVGQRRFQATNSVNANVLGYPVRGSAQTRAQTSVTLVPSDRKAILVIPVNGSVMSTTITDAGRAGVQVHSNSVTNFQQAIEIFISEDGIEINQKPLQTQSRRVITNITTPVIRPFRGLVRRRAYRKVDANKRNFDYVANQLARDRISHEIVKQVHQCNAILERALSHVSDVYEKAISDLSLQVDVESSPDCIRLALVRPGEQHRQSSKNSRPTPKQAPVFVQIHATLIRKALNHSEIRDLLKPLISRFNSDQSPTTRLTKQVVDKGRCETKWSADLSWVTLYWYPAQTNLKSESGRLPMEMASRR